MKEDQKKNKSIRITTGFLLILVSILMPPIARSIDYFTKFHGYICPEKDHSVIEILDVSVSAYNVILVAGLLCIVPIGDWIRAWRQNK